MKTIKVQVINKYLRYDVGYKTIEIPDGAEAEEIYDILAETDLTDVEWDENDSYSDDGDLTWEVV